MRALEADCELDVVVSTDSPEIAEIAVKAGADVPGLRPSELAQDTTPTEPVVEHVMAQRREQGKEFEAVMLLQATSPLRSPGTLDAAVKQFYDTGVDSLVGVVPAPPFIWRFGQSGEAQAEYDYRSRKRRQDMASSDLRYRENGSLYVTKPEIYDRLHNRLGGRIGMFILSELEGVDIDSHLDFRLAELQMADYFATEGL